MTDSIDHVIRSTPPWREAASTECGLDLPGRQLITRKELVARVAEHGQRRAAFVTCMTCWETVSRTSSWEDDPAQAMSREFGRYGVKGSAALMRRELRALMLLVEAHREEFAELLAALAATPHLSAVRARRGGRRAVGGGS